MSNKKARVIAFYLPQFYPTAENDRYWGKGFTEWTNVAKAKPLFKGHEQPKIPADLGFYDLRLPIVREQQAEMAREAGIEGFMYWHYWFGDGVMTLTDVFEEVLHSGKPDFPFCLGWANHSWSNKSWTKGKAFQKDVMIFEMKYPGKDDIINHFYYCLPAFKDKRYITVKGKPLFYIWDPLNLPNAHEFINIWNELAIENGLNGIHFVGRKEQEQVSVEEYSRLGFNAVQLSHQKYAEDHALSSTLIKKVRGAVIKFTDGASWLLRKYDYGKIIKNLSIPEEDSQENAYPTILSGYDRSPRSGKKAVIYTNYTPELFSEHIKRVISNIENKDEENKIVFLKSWNEWAEGNYLEPDLKYGHSFLDVLRKNIVKQ